MSRWLRLLPRNQGEGSPRLSRCVFLVAFSLIAASCGGGPNDDEASPGGSETGELATAQELVIGAGGDPWVNAAVDRKRLPNYPLNADVCETLVRLGTDFRLEPSLASSWEFVGDNTYRFTLNDGATFSDGRPLSADDVKFSIDYTAQEPTIGNSFLSTDSATAIDDLTVDIQPERPNLRLVDEINHPTYAVLTPGNDPLNDHNVTCTGPFKVVAYSPEEELVVERNEDYWGEPAKLDRITFRFIPDETTRVLALQNGEVDLIIDVPRGIATSVDAQPGIKLATAPVGNVTLIIPSRRDAEGNPKLMSDPLLRRALAASIDTESYVNGVLGGLAEVVDTVAPPAVLGEFADLVEGVDYDPEAAEELLDQAGWARDDDGIRAKDGQPLEMKIIFPQGAGGGFGTEVATIEFVQAQMRAVGIDGQIAQLDPGAYSEAQMSGDYDLNISTPNQNNANPAFLLAISFYAKGPFATSKIVAPGLDTAYEAMIDQTQVAEDPETLRRLAAEAMHESW